MLAEEVKRRIEAGLPGAYVEVRDFTGTGDHFEAIIVSDKFAGLTLVQRHQTVYRTLGEAVGGEVHALTLKALTPEQYGQQR